jgi:hypothetical protein
MMADAVSLPAWRSASGLDSAHRNESRGVVSRLRRSAALLAELGLPATQVAQGTRPITQWGAGW